MKISLENNKNSRIQILLKDPITKNILYIFGSMSEASKYLDISYKTFQRHLNIHPVQIYGAPDFIRKWYSLDKVIWEKSEKFLEIPPAATCAAARLPIQPPHRARAVPLPLEIKNLLLGPKLVEKSKESFIDDNLGSYQTKKSSAVAATFQHSQRWSKSWSRCLTLTARPFDRHWDTAKSWQINNAHSVINRMQSHHPFRPYADAVGGPGFRAVLQAGLHTRWRSSVNAERVKRDKKELNYVLKYRGTDWKKNDVTEEIKSVTEGKVGIYLIENLMNNFKFIGAIKSAGKDKLGFYRAFRKIVLNNSERYVFLRNDIKSYGIESFNFIILEFTREQEVVMKKNLYITKLDPEYNKKQLDKTRNRETPQLDPPPLPVALLHTLVWPRSYPRPSGGGEGKGVCTFSQPNAMRRSFGRIRTHPEKIISIIFGIFLQGGSYAERREYSTMKGLVKGGTRICFEQEDSNVEYLMSFWKDIAEMGYCRQEKPRNV